MADGRDPAPDLVVQVVLYETPHEAIRGQLRALCLAGATAIDAGSLRSVRVAYGDSSDVPVLDAALVAELDATARAGGLDGADYHFFDANLGSGGGSNRLAEPYDSELLLVLNPDAHPEPRLLVELAGTLTDPGVGACDARQLPLEHPKAHDRTTGDASWVSGACMALRRTVFDQVEGFAAEYFPLYCDDVDISWRIRLAGWRVVHNPAALVFHDKRLSAEGRVVASETERYWSLYAGMLLARRYGRDDLMAPILAHVEAIAPVDDAAARALADWRRRQVEGTLPPALPGAAAVADFIAGNYGVMRF